MQTRITPDEIHAAARRLAMTERGRASMQRLQHALDTGGLDLDLLDQRAFLALLGGVWTNQVDDVRAAMGEALAAKPEPGS
jgi:hypothetical protein